MVDWKSILGEILTQTLRILLPVVIALILKWAAEIWIKIKAERPDIASILEYAARIAVRAAEQIFGEGHGEEKKEYAIATVEQYLAENGLSLDVTVIADAIEAEVYREFTAWKLIQQTEKEAEE